MTLVRDVLGADALGAYLFGSAALGGLKPESDLDVLVLSRRRTERKEKARLVERLLSISGRATPTGRWRRLEVTIVVDDEIRPWRFPPRFDFQYGDWFRRKFEAGELEPWPSTTNGDLATLIAMARVGDSPLFGPRPAQAFEPVPHADLIAAMTGDIPSLLDVLDRDTGNIVLTLTRIWSTATTAEFRSKDAAADWALERLPDEHRAVLARARAVYLGEEEERWDDLREQIRPHADHVVAEIAGTRVD